MSGLERVEQSHNDYLQVLADAGIVGALIGLFFLFRLFVAGRAATGIRNDYRRGIAVGAIAGIFAILRTQHFRFRASHHRDLGNVSRSHLTAYRESKLIRGRYRGTSTTNDRSIDPREAYRL
jgi:hypothetical protein